MAVLIPWLDDGDARLFHGDALDVLRQLPSGSVHACMTSPPFFGLRDYQTGTWEGGDADCDHKAPSRFDYPLQSKLGGERPKPLSQESNAGSGQATEYRSKCGKCGARRVDRQIGLEETPDEWVSRLVAVFREVRRVLRDDGVLFVEIGDSYNAYNGNRGPSASISAAADDGRNEPERGLTTTACKPKDLLGQPWLLAFALRADGWYLRSEIIWAKPNAMPESCTDRPTKSHSTIFLLSKRPRYFMDMDAIREPHQHDGRKVTTVQQGEGSIQHRNGERWPGTGANARSVWWQATEPTPYAHFATWPQALVRRMILAGTSERGCCPECGAPWVRETSAEQDYYRQPKERTWEGPHGTKQADILGHSRKVVTTLGWSPSCSCHKIGSGSASPPVEAVSSAPEPMPCTVLDPFAGSGTTCLVARNHGRHSIGIELNEDYLEIARERLQQLSLLASPTTGDM